MKSSPSESPGTSCEMRFSRNGLNAASLSMSIVFCEPVAGYEMLYCASDRERRGGRRAGEQRVGVMRGVTKWWLFVALRTSTLCLPITQARQAASCAPTRRRQQPRAGKHANGYGVTTRVARLAAAPDGSPAPLVTHDAQPPTGARDPRRCGKWLCLLACVRAPRDGRRGWNCAHDTHTDQIMLIKMETSM